MYTENQQPSTYLLSFLHRQSTLILYVLFYFCFCSWVTSSKAQSLLLILCSGSTGILCSARDGKLLLFLSSLYCTLDYTLYSFSPVPVTLILFGFRGNLVRESTPGSALRSAPWRCSGEATACQQRVFPPCGWRVRTVDRMLAVHTADPSSSPGTSNGSLSPTRCGP